MVEVKHESRYSGKSILFTCQVQQVYYLSYPHESMKNWWVTYKVNLEMHPRQNDEYVERDEDDDVIHVYQEEIEGHQSFMVSDGARLIELATRDTDLMEEEPGPSKKCLWKSKCVAERQESHERLDACVTDADSDTDDF
jgi:hypothetical protein